MAKEFTLSQFKVESDARIPGPSNKMGDKTPYGYRISPIRGNQDDSARYLLFPDTEFHRPWIANPPGGTAFVWPLGIQGFQYNSQASLGIHHYIGDNDVDVDVVYPDELHISLSGHFPGKTSAHFMFALRKVILDPTGKAGKILSLPGVDEEILFVSVLSHSFTHDENDNTSSIAYQIEMVKTGEAGANNVPPLRPPAVNPSTKKKSRGKPSKQTVVRHGHRTVRKKVNKIYGGAGGRVMASFIRKNAEELEKDGVPAYTAAFTPIQSGTVLKY